MVLNAPVPDHCELLPSPRVLKTINDIENPPKANQITIKLASTVTEAASIVPFKYNIILYRHCHKLIVINYE